MSRGLLFALMMAAVPMRLEAQVEPRILYPHHNGGCYWVTDRAECCKHTDGRNYSQAGHYYHERCVPAAAGKEFTSGRICEPECWVQGLCGDGTPQGDRIGQCLAADAEEEHDNILVVSEDTSSTSILIVSEDTSTRTMTTTTLFRVPTPVPVQPVHMSNKDKVIAGAVAGGVGGVALLGGLLGGLLTTVTTALPSATVLATTTTTAAPTVIVTSNVSHTRFLEGSAHAALAQHFGSPWMATLALSALITLATFAVVFQVKSKSEARNLSGGDEIAESTDEESISSPAVARNGPDAFDLIDQNHDGVISREEFNAAYGMQHMVTVATAAPVYVLPSSQWVPR